MLLILALLVSGGSCSGPSIKKEEVQLQSAKTDSIPSYWPRGVRKVEIASSFDKSIQPALFWAPSQKDKPAPLLVVLHTWMGDYLQDMSVPCLKEAMERGWVFIHPNFRGPNTNSMAMGSEAATADMGAVPLNYQMAGAVILVLPVIVLFFLAQRYFVQGLTQGSINK